MAQTELQKRIDQLAQCTVPWLSKSFKKSSIVVSTRVRLARNLSGYPFPAQASKECSLGVFGRISNVVQDLPAMTNSIFAEIVKLPKIDRQLLFERHLISSQQIKAKEGSGVFISTNETYSITINEEDHLRLQAIRPGLQLNETWFEIDQLDDCISHSTPFSYKEGLGYLTSCPTNVGTGLRASVMLHLPALVINNQINPVMRALEQMNYAVRGLYGEGSDPSGNFFQISNQSTLGEYEGTILRCLEKVIRRVIELEKNARQYLVRHKQVELCDHIERSLGLLIHCHLLSSKEALSELSLVRLGIDLGMFSVLKASTVNKLLANIQSAHMQKHLKTRLTTKERDAFRASMVKNTLKNFISCGRHQKK